MSRESPPKGSVPSLSVRSPSGLRRSIEGDPIKRFEPILGIASTYLAARYLGAWPAAFVSGLWAAILGRAWSRQVDALGRSIEHYSRLALLDDLTSLANDRSFRESLVTYFTQSGLAGEALSLILVDVDQFKLYNDTFGHPAGDEALKVFGRCLVANSGEAVRVYRVGGDEFALILPKTDRPTALDVAGQLRVNLGNLDWPLRPITASFGVASIAGPAPGADLAGLRIRADRALYRAKAMGGNRVVDQVDAGPKPD